MAKTKVKHPELKYVHIRSEQGKGSVTIGYKVEGNKVFYTRARCAPFDNFCRKIGRDICAGRMAVHGPCAEFEFKEVGEIKKLIFEKEHPDVYLSGEGDASKSKVFDNYSYVG